MHKLYLILNVALRNTFFKFASRQSTSGIRNPCASHVMCIILKALTIYDVASLKLINDLDCIVKILGSHHVVRLLIRNITIFFPYIRGYHEKHCNCLV